MTAASFSVSSIESELFFVSEFDLADFFSNFFLSFFSLGFFSIFCSAFFFEVFIFGNFFATHNVNLVLYLILEQLEKDILNTPIR